MTKTASEYYYARHTYYKEQRRKWRLNNKSYFDVYRKKNKEKLKLRARDRRYQKKYGITLSQYDEMFARQNGRCAVCLCETPSRLLAVDHCHTTGKVRGLLCFQCNLYVVGRLENNPGSLTRLLAYLGRE